MQIAIFSLVATTIWAGVTYYLGHRLIIGSGLQPPTSLIAWIALISVCAVSPAALFLRRSFSIDSPVLAWAGFIAMGFIAILFSLTVFKDLTFLALRLIDLPSDPTRRAFFSTVANGGILATSATGAVIGLREAVRDPSIERVEIPIPGLPDSLVGFTITQFSDLHVGATIKLPYVERVVEMINELGADVIVFTGDLVDGFPNDLDGDLKPLKNLRAKNGTYYVTGNHEYYWNAAAWVRYVEERLDFKPLMNSHALIEHNGGRLLMAGVTDPTSKDSSPKKAKENAPEHDVSVLLAHQPKSIYEAIEQGFDLQLSGHTHGGQFWPWNLFVGLAHPFTRGLTFYKKAIYAYVNRGTGYWGPPNRLGIPSEITLLTLIRA